MNLQTIRIEKGNRKIEIDFDVQEDGTWKHLYTDYIENGYPVECLR